MILTYTDVEREPHRIRAEITTDHPASLRGQPVIVLEGGEVLDMFSWAALGYRVVQASEKEVALLERIGLL